MSEPPKPRPAFWIRYLKNLNKFPLLTKGNVKVFRAAETPAIQFNSPPEKPLSKVKRERPGIEESPEYRIDDWQPHEQLREAMRVTLLAEANMPTEATEAEGSTEDVLEQQLEIARKNSLERAQANAMKETNTPSIPETESTTTQEQRQIGQIDYEIEATPVAKPLGEVPGEMSR